MCAINGHLSPHTHQLESFITLRDRMHLRGPDDAGLWQDQKGTVRLGHRRLSILDLSTNGHQPMSSDCGRFVIVFNGEVYNYLELKRELENYGYQFKGSGDTEVVLASYHKWGQECLSKFNGMFAFAIYDQGTANISPSLFMARDRAGKKPFYYAHKGKVFAFASELKAIPTSLKGSIDFKALNYYLALGYVPNELCIVEGVKKLPAGYAARFYPESGLMNTWRWWSLPSFESSNSILSGDALAEESWELLKDAVKIRLRSDVPVGIFLSGGLDSSLIAAAAAECSHQPISTFTIGIPGSELDESHHARLIANHFGTQHHLLELPETSLDVLEELSLLIDEPIADSSIIPTYLVSKLTRQHVTVALGGDGGDEVFGGYPHYQQVLSDKRNLGWVPFSLLQHVASLAAHLPAGVRGRNRLASLQGGINQTHVWGTPYFDRTLRTRILHSDVVAELGANLDAPEQYQLGLMKSGNSPVDALMRMDFQSVMVEDYLVKVDRSSMANSLEVRSPFLDYRLIEYAFKNIPNEWKVTLDERRRIQNLMAKKHLPKEFELNRKQGFSIPMDNWLRAGNISEKLSMLPSGLINSNAVTELVTGLNRGRSNGARLFCLIMLALSNIN